jgi:uncharacterized protein
VALRFWVAGLFGASFVAGASLATSATASAEPTFNCDDGAPAADLAICRSSVLAMYDRNLSYLYRRAIGIDDDQLRYDRLGDQASWLRARGLCESDEGCLIIEYGRRIDSLILALPPETEPVRVQFPHDALSWGGSLLSAPDPSADVVGTLEIGSRLRLLEDTGTVRHGFRWFRVEHGDVTAYQWGGVICAVGTPVPGTYRTCD